MKKCLLILLLFSACLPSPIDAQPQQCPTKLADCPPEGCGTHADANLNNRKNLTSDDQTPTLRTLAWMKKLDDPENFVEGDTREELTALGEGQKITVVAYLLAAKAELGGESCNCGLKTAAGTDNHLVLVTRATVEKYPATDFHSRELQSITAEFTPRVRLDHKNFTREVMQPMIDKTKKKALLVRVTGPLMFDSEHFLKNHLTRVNNWEIHPVMKMEYCTTGYTCKATSDTGWKSLDDL